MLRIFTELRTVLKLQRISSIGTEEDQRPVDPSTKSVTPLQALWCAFIALLLCLHHQSLPVLSDTASLHVPGTVLEVA